jgi:hypothetical protein
MSIERYAKFISEQARIASLDEADAKKRRLEITHLRPKEYGLVDPKTKTDHGTITHEKDGDGYVVRLKYKGKKDETFPATGTDFLGPHFDKALKRAKELHQST